MLTPLVAEADEFRLLPSISQDLMYNDNVYLTPTLQTHDFISYTVGGLQLLDSTELLNLDTSVKVAQSLYKDNTRLDSTDVLTNGTARYSLTPELALSGRVNYTRDSQPDRDLLTTGLVLSGVRREHETYGATADYNLTDQTLASLSYDHWADHYGKSFTTTTAFSNLSYDTATLAFQHDLTKFLPSTKGLLDLTYAQYSLTGIDVYNYEATAGFKYALQEKWSIQALAGPSYTQSSFNIFVPTLVVSSWGGVGQASLNYTGEVTSAAFSASRDIAPASGLNGAVERTSFSLSAERRLSYEFKGLLSASYFINKSGSGQYSATPINYQTFNFAPGIRYEFNRDMYLEASYTFTRIEDRQADLTANRNLFLVRFFIQHAVME